MDVEESKANDNGGTASNSNAVDTEKPSAEEQDPRTKTKRKYYIGNGISTKYRPNMEVKGPLKDGLIDDWDAYENIWNYAFNDYLRADTETHPILTTEAAWNIPALREKLTELAFEKFKVPAFLSVTRQSYQRRFAAGKHTSLIIDSGSQCSSVVPVYEGFALKQAIAKQTDNFGGDLVTGQILKQLERNYHYKPRGLFEIAGKSPVESMKTPNVQLCSNVDQSCITDSFRKETWNNIVQEYKESVCSASTIHFGLFNGGPELANEPQKPFEFPDGFNLSVGIERFRTPEVMFRPNELLEKYGGDTGSSDNNIVGKKNVNGEQQSSSQEQNSKDKQKLLGIHELTVASLSRTDIDLRPHLLGNVVLSGGNTAFPLFSERISAELINATPGSKVRLFSATSLSERKFMPWLGGSILSSLGTFHQMWISRQEYEEQGASVVGKKCH
ncbi:NuA4 histone acetyltransferase subunit [Mycoemilia scoparia]|uniref:NuA4 histone acetyltransferase subunit n=1 Tax=Mycoemilia scoparia TaxID=417184 RepID=A0A9W7ZUW9_9FUNG|nr:NuA4 histone acetyltransferase subunit [Mycoemilia scoparia]